MINLILLYAKLSHDHLLLVGNTTLVLSVKQMNQKESVQFAGNSPVMLNQVT